MNTVDELFARVNRNRVLLLGLAMAVLTAVAAGTPLIGILIALVSFLQRSQAVPAKEHKELEREFEKTYDELIEAEVALDVARGVR